METYDHFFHFISCAHSIVKAVEEHHNQQSSEIKKLYKHWKKCYDVLNKYLGMIIDAWTRIKHFYHILFVHPKIYRKRISINFTLSVVWFSKIHNDANMTITIIHHVLTHSSGNLPQVIYLQLDNNSGENKNQIVFGYLSMGIFQKVKVGFLIVENTHDYIDQIFNHFSVTFKRKNVGTLPSLIECIKKAYIPEHVFHILEETIDMQRFI
jgi:hypothetical protein